MLPDLSLVTLTQRPVGEHDRMVLLPESGVAAAQAGDASLAGSVLIGLQAALDHGSGPALRQACAVALPELKAALRTLLHYHLGTPVMRTRQVMIDLQTLNP